jgi:hypothetical protein
MHGLILREGYTTLVDQIDLKSIELSRVQEAFDWIATNADIVSKVGAIELAIAYGKCSPKMVSTVIIMTQGRAKPSGRDWHVGYNEAGASAAH